MWEGGGVSDVVVGGSWRDGGRRGGGRRGTGSHPVKQTSGYKSSPLCQHGPPVR